MPVCAERPNSAIKLRERFQLEAVVPADALTASASDEEQHSRGGCWKRLLRRRRRPCARHRGHEALRQFPIAGAHPHCVWTGPVAERLGLVHQQIGYALLLEVDEEPISVL